MPYNTVENPVHPSSFEGLCSQVYKELSLWQNRACQAPGTTRSRHRFVPEEIYFAVSKIRGFAVSPDNLISDGSVFGHSTSEYLRPDFTTGARQIQMGIKLSF